MGVHSVTPDEMTLVSLFDGVGGFPLAFRHVGVRTVATVEIDDMAAGVVHDQFPGVPRFPDVTEVTGDQLLAAGFDPGRGIITAGFPCQDLSLAGRRMGLDGTRSGLYFEIVRLVDELRQATGVWCRWLVLENVPGLLSAVCPCPGGGACDGTWESTQDPEFGFPGRVHIPCVAAHTVRGGACGPGRCIEIHGGAMGAVVGELAERRYGYAYRVLDAQHFGVPQRRRRVVIVANPRDWAAPAQVLLEPQGRGGDPEAGRKAAARTAAVLARSPYLAGRGRTDDTVGTLPAREDGGGFGYGASEAAAGLLVPQVADTLTARIAKGSPTSKGDGFTLVGASDVDVAGTLTGTMAGAGGGADENGAAVGHLMPMAFDTAPMNNAKIVPGGPAHTLNTFAQASVHLPPEAYIVDKERGLPNDQGITVEATDVSPTITADGDPGERTDRGLRIVDTAYALRRDPGGVGQGHNTNYVPMTIGVSSDPTPIATDDVSPTITVGTGIGIPNPPSVMAFDWQKSDHPASTLGVEDDRSMALGTTRTPAVAGEPVAAVRRLTPVECERLQGYPDGWTATSHGRPQADSHRYREMGNSIAVPVFHWVALGIVESEATE